MKCELCGRDYPDNVIQYHHIVPKSKKGEVTIPVCPSCHSFVHKTWTNKELRDSFNTIEAVVSDERFQKFVKWLLKQPIDRVHKTQRNSQRDPHPFR